MAIRKDKIVVIDIEATCWDTAPPPGEINEIIEIGGVLLDPSTGEITHKTSILVQPTQSKISDFCTKLTSITPQMVESTGVVFSDALQQLQAALGVNDRLWASWGNYDKRMFEEQCQRWSLPYPFSPLHMNIKKFYAIHENQRKQIGMTRALDALGLQLEGKHHRGDDDAWNIARILAAILQKHGTDVLKKHW